MSDFKGVWIPAKVWEYKDLSLIEKCFLCKIYSLDNNEGCTAGNAFFAEFFDVSKSRCTQILKVLEDAELIKITLFREGKEIVKRVVNLLNRGIEFFNEGGEKIKQGSEFIKQGSEKIKEGYLENSADKNRELRIEDKNKNEEEGAKKDPLPQNEDFNILKDLISKLTLEVESLKAEKEKEKNCAKKEKEDLVGDAPPVTPPHKTDALQSARYSADESKDLKPYEVAIFNYQYPATWTDGVKENFKYFCDSAHEKSKGKFGSSNAKGIIIDVNNALQLHKAELVAAALFLCGKNNWSFDINFEINRRAKNQKDAESNSNDEPIKNKYERFAERNGITLTNTQSNPVDTGSIQEFN